MNTWQNWSGGVACDPSSIHYPASESVLTRVVKDAARASQKVRAVGSGHSFTPLCTTAGALISLDAHAGVVSVDRDRKTAAVRAGTRVSELGEPLQREALALLNQGDIDRQSIAGAITTGTHGTGLGFGSMSTQVSAVRLLTASGEIVTCSALQSPELFRAAQLSLGALGIISELTLQLCPAYRLHEKNWSMEVEECLAEFDSMERNNCHAEFFWVPAVDRCAVKTLNNTDEAPRGAAPRSLAPPGTIERYLLPERVDWSHRIFPSERVVKFNEMEFAVPYQSGPDCFREIRALMQGCHHSVIWAVEYRTQGADDLYLSPAYERDSVTLSVHQAAELSHDDFFRDVESIFRNHRGRPHWGKLHSHDARELSELYPAWENFLQVREQVDPDGMFLNDYLCGLLKGA